ncbi:MAG: hypothetical protein AAB336_12290 [Acidobacteriota bacterium]
MHIILIGYYTSRYIRFSVGFPKVEKGQSKQAAIELMGQESEKANCNSTIRNKYYDVDCFEIYAYYSILDYWAIAFDKDGKVVKKYNWTFDDGYGRPHDFDE